MKSDETTPTPRPWTYEQFMQHQNQVAKVVHLRPEEVAYLSFVARAALQKAGGK